MGLRTLIRMLLRTPSAFRRLWVGQFVSTIGDGMQRIALLWWAKHHGGNGLLVAVALSTIVPTIVCSPIGGWLASGIGARACAADTSSDAAVRSRCQGARPGDASNRG